MSIPIKQKNILFAIGGFQPQIITQALYHFNIDKKIRIGEVIIVSTKTTIGTYYNGYPVRKTPKFLGKEGKLVQFFEEYGLATPILRVFKIVDSNENEIEQLRNPNEFDAAALTILNKLRGIALGEHDNVYCIYAGGQRVLASYLMSSLILVGDNRHHLFYIQVNEKEVQESPNFFFPPKNPLNIKKLDGVTINTSNIKISANEINYPRLAIKYSGVIRNDSSYQSILDHIQGYISTEQKPVKITELDNDHEPFIIGKSVKLKESLEMVKKFALAGLSPIMLYGETGTGKELFADYYQYWFRQQQKEKTKYIVINCAAIPKELIESELFGAAKGSYTGANEDRIGQLTSADGGVAFLDEINSAPLSMQAKLLRFIETGEVQILGRIPNELKQNAIDGKLKVNVKIVSAMNEHAETLIKKGELRKDLYFRLVKGKINLPPLRERKEDIPELVTYFLDKSCEMYKKSKVRLSDSLMKKICETEWLGNIRDLKGYIERLVVLSEPDESGIISEFDEPIEEFSLSNSPDLSSQQIMEAIAGNDYQSKSFDDLVANFESWIITRAYLNNESNASQTAKELQIAVSTLKDKLKKYSIS